MRWCGRTTGKVIAGIITDPKLAAILSAQWGTYGGKPKEGSFGVHATVMAHYLEGAGYPAGGAGAIAKGLVPVIESAGGRALAGTPVSHILIENGKAVGVRTSAGDEYRAPVMYGVPFILGRFPAPRAGRSGRYRGQRNGGYELREVVLMVSALVSILIESLRTIMESSLCGAIGVVLGPVLAKHQRLGTRQRLIYRNQYL